MRDRGFNNLRYHFSFQKLDIHSEPNILALTKDTTKVVSEDEGTMVSIEDIVCQEGAFSKGSAKRGCPHSISVSKQNTLCMSNCSPYPKTR